MGDKSEMALDDGEGGFLPDTLVPIHYDIQLFDMQLDAEPRTFCGRSTIDIRVEGDTDTIILDAHQLSDVQASMDSGQPGVISVDHAPALQRLYVRLNGPLRVGSDVHLTLQWQGLIGDEVGFYQSGSSQLFCTQFQPIDARRAFPAFDQPGFKSTFALSLEVPEEMVVLSNMPVSSTRPSDTARGRQWTKFETTPRMSCYLLAWAFGALDHVETTVLRKDGTRFPVRVYASAQQVPHAAFALDIAKRSLELFAIMFDIDFPLPKCDLLAVPEMTDDAMENWGLCIFRSTCLLVEGDVLSNPEDAVEVAYIIAHELAHQWFGNLVTPTTWDELWLNEGFATWAGWHAVRQLRPDWHTDVLFVRTSMDEGLQLDAMASSHPVQVHMTSGLEVDALFDSISYFKGASIIRMLAAYLGQERFVHGVGAYLKANAYGSTTGKALWDALTGETGEDVGALVKPWISQVGFPQVSVLATNENDRIRLVQHRFGFPQDETTWWIPLVIQTSAGDQRVHLTTKETEILLHGSLASVNRDKAGFLRVILPTDQALALGSRLDELSPQDRISLLSDAYAAVFTGTAHSIRTIMDLVRMYKEELSADVWAAVIVCMHAIDTVFGAAEDIASGLEDLMADLIQTRLKSVSWNPSPDDSYDTACLRPLLLREAGFSGVHNDRYAKEAYRRFRQRDEFRRAPFAVQRAICDVAVADKGMPVVDQLFRLYHEASTEREKDIFIEAMGCVGKPGLARRIIKRAFGDRAIATQDLSTLCEAIASNGTTTDVVWEFIRDEWDLAYARMGDATTTLERFLKSSLSYMHSLGRVDEVGAFFRSRDTTGYARGVAVAIDIVRANAAFKGREQAGLRGWLDEHGHLD